MFKLINRSVKVEHCYFSTPLVLHSRQFITLIIHFYGCFGHYQTVKLMTQRFSNYYRPVHKYRKIKYLTIQHYIQTTEKSLELV